MHSLSLAATTLFAAGALAGNLNQLLPRELQVRQDQSFTPSTNFGQGETCAEAFGAGSIDCNGVCYKPGEGEICCAGNGDAYPCPDNSFCLINGLCCPDGLPAETCATQNGVTLPEGFSTDAPSTPSTPGTTSPANPVGPTTTPIVPTPIPLPSPIPDTAPYPLPSVIPGNATKPAGTAVPTGSGPGSPVTPFTGGAGNVKAYCGGLLAGVMGVLGMLL